MRILSTLSFGAAMFVALSISSVPALPASAPSAARNAEALIVLAKVKCDLNRDGDVVCRTQNRRQPKPEHKPEPKPDSGPKPSKAGQCMTTETSNSGALDCGALARSCGAVENGKVTCCCRN